MSAARGLAEDGPQLQHDAGHTGYTPDPPRPPLRLRWIHYIEEPTAAACPPIVAAGKVFFGTNWGNVVARDRPTGAPVWRYHTDAPVIATPTYHDGLVYVASMDRRCHALNAASGQRRWVFETDEGFSAAPVVAEGKVFVAGRDGWAYALGAADGHVIWRTPVGAMVMATPAYADGTLFVGSGDQHIYALDTSFGARAVAFGAAAWRGHPRLLARGRSQHGDRDDAVGLRCPSDVSAA